MPRAALAAGNRKGIDYSWGRPGVSAITAAGYTFVCRYLSYTPDKNLTPAEAQSLIGAGIDIVANWEATASAALEGYARGVSDAQEAQRQASSCGMPADRPIYFSVDFDASAGQQAALNSYFDGIASVIGRSRTGAYGGYYVIKRLFDAGKITWGWQTYAWSSGQWDARAQLRQVQNGITVGGADCDLDEAIDADFGQWGSGPATLSRYLYTLEAGAVYETYGSSVGWQKNRVAASSATLMSATWSPSSERYIYTVEGGVLYEYFGSPTGWQKTRVANTAASLLSATWSPAGARYLYTVENNEICEYYGSPSGWQRVSFASSAASLLSATWSRAGKRYVYTMESGILYEYYGGPTGWQKVEVGSRSASSLSATWSPSAERYLYTVEGTELYEIYGSTSGWRRARVAATTASMVSATWGNG